MMVTHGRGRIALNYESGEQKPRLMWSKSAPGCGSSASNPAKWGGNGKFRGKPAHHSTHPDQRHRLPCSRIPPTAGSCCLFLKGPKSKRFLDKRGNSFPPLQNLSKAGSCCWPGPPPSPAHPPTSSSSFGLSHTFSGHPFHFTPSSCLVLIYVAQESLVTLSFSSEASAAANHSRERDTENQHSWERS